MFRVCTYPGVTFLALELALQGSKLRFKPLVEAQAQASYTLNASWSPEAAAPVQKLKAF